MRSRTDLETRANYEIKWNKKYEKEDYLYSCKKKYYGSDYDPNKGGVYGKCSESGFFGTVNKLLRGLPVQEQPCKEEVFKRYINCARKA